MAIRLFQMLQHDLQPYYPVQVKDSAGVVVSITGATIYCTMRLIDDSTGEPSTTKINRQTAGISITDGANGKFEYRWVSGDTGITGKFQIEFEINPAAGGKFTVPNPSDGKAYVKIVEDLDGQ